MKIHRLRGGVHPHAHKNATTMLPITAVPLPPRLFVPLRQHAGSAAEPAVRVGQYVARGDLVGRPAGPVSAPVHAPTSGVVVAIEPHTAHHPSGLPATTVVLVVDGEDARGGALPACDDPLALPPGEIAQRVAAAGIVGMGGAAFPAAIKLGLGGRYPVHTLILNGAECEPYLSADDRIMQERAPEILEGARLMARALGAARIVMAVEADKAAACRAMARAAGGLEDVELARLPARYPTGSARHLAQAVTGREIPARSRTAELGVVVHNVATAFAVHEAVRHGRPLTSRVLTLGGGALPRPANLEVRIGTPVAHLLAACGGTAGSPARLVSGGPMMGQPLPGPEVPVVKATTGVLALSAAEVEAARESPCIRCGTCVQVCPSGLVPADLVAHVRAGDLEGAERLGLGECIACGACAWACPSRVPIVQYLAHARGLARQRRAERQKQERVRRLAERRTARIAEQQRRKREAMARRKAEANAKDSPEARP